MAHFAGFFTQAAYSEEQERVRVLLAEKAQDPRYEHLIAYRDAWDRLRANHPSQPTSPEPSHSAPVYE